MDMTIDDFLLVFDFHLGIWLLEGGTIENEDCIVVGEFTSNADAIEAAKNIIADLKINA